MKAVILGGGLSGCVAANELGKKGIETIIIEKKRLSGRWMPYFFLRRTPLYGRSQTIGNKRWKSF